MALILRRIILKNHLKKKKVLGRSKFKQIDSSQVSYSDVYIGT